MNGQTRCIVWCAVSSRAQNEPDKISLPQQETDARALAHQHNWQIVEVLKVPGHSRRYIDFHVLAEDAGQSGIDAFHRLRQHWEERDFDVLIVRDGERFARTQALHAYVIERTIDIGARIYSLIDGWIDDQNYRMWIAMGGYKAAGDIDRLVKARDKAMDALAERGLPTASRIPMSHNLIRDPKSGKALCLEVNEQYRRLWDDLATVILEGVAWDRVEEALYQRFGHANEQGEAYYPNFMYNLVKKPIFWGHSARHYAHVHSKYGYRLANWTFDEEEPIPDGVIMHRNTHPAVWTDDLADQIQAELRRRTDTMRGRRRPWGTHRFSGLCVCGECGSTLATHSDVKSNYRAMVCKAANSRTRRLPECSNTRGYNEKRMIERVSEFLQQMLEQNTPDIFNDDVQQPNYDQQLTRLEDDISQLEAQARVLIRKQATAEENIQRLYDDELIKISEQLHCMKEARLRLQTEASSAYQSTTIQYTTLEQLAEMTVETFWQQESRVINQMLHRLMGKRKFVILNRELIGIATVNMRRRKNT